jgi:transposase
MITEEGKAKVLRTILTERSINCTTLKKDDMVKILEQHDYTSEMKKTIVETFQLAKGHYIMFFPKFHCEFNSIERVWAQAKVCSL